MLNTNYVSLKSNYPDFKGTPGGGGDQQPPITPFSLQSPLPLSILQPSSSEGNGIATPSTELLAFQSACSFWEDKAGPADLGRLTHNAHGICNLESEA